MPEPRYRQIAEDLRRQIESGILTAGDQLPTELDLQEHYSASRNTVRDALKWLATRGLIQSRSGQGTFVARKLDPFVTDLSANPDTALGGGEGTRYQEEVTALGRTLRNTEPIVEIQPARGKVAKGLRLPPGEMVVSRHQRRFIDGDPYSLQTSFYPMSLIDGGARRLIEASNIPQGAVKYLRDDFGIEQAGYRDVITVRVPDQDETDFFNLPDDGRVAVLVTDRTAFDQYGAPCRFTVTVYPADRNQFVINVRSAAIGQPTDDSRHSESLPVPATGQGSSTGRT